MTAAEMKLERDLEYFRMKSAELDERDSQIRQIIAVFNEREQRLEDTFNLSGDYKTTAAAHFKLKELRDLRKEIETILGQEG